MSPNRAYVGYRNRMTHNAEGFANVGYSVLLSLAWP